MTIARRNASNQSTLTCTVVLAATRGFFLILVFFSLGCTKQRDVYQEVQDKLRAEVEERETISAEFVRSDNAALDWEKELPSRVAPFTEDMKRALIRQDGRPTLWFGQIADVYSEEGSYYAVFHSYGEESLADVLLILRCSDQQADLIMKTDELEYVFVASVTKVVKPLMALSTEESRGEAPLRVLMSLSPFDNSTFLVSGDCRDFKALKGNIGRTS